MAAIGFDDRAVLANEMGSPCGDFLQLLVRFNNDAGENVVRKIASAFKSADQGTATNAVQSMLKR